MMDQRVKSETPKKRTSQYRKNPPLKGKFLDAYLAEKTVSHACRATKVPRANVYRWLKDDARFKQQFRDVRTEVVENLEREAYRRAAEGTIKPVYHQGRMCGGIKEFSDTLLIFLLKAAKPKKYRENIKIDANVSGGVLVVGGTAQTADEWASKYTKVE